MHQNHHGLTGRTDQLSQLSDRFAAELSAGNDPRIENYLSDVDDHDIVPLFCELLGLEFEHRRAMGLASDLPMFSRRFPQFRGVIEFLGSRMDAAMASARRIVAIYRAGMEVIPSQRDSKIDELCSGEKDVRSVMAYLFSSMDSTCSRLTDSNTLPYKSLDAPPRSKPTLVLSTLAERFDIIRFLGAGGYSEVYEAVDKVRGATVALKILRRCDPHSILRFKQEFRVLADVSHPNLVNLHEFFIENNQCFLTMELVRGTSFRRSLLEPATYEAEDSDHFGRLRRLLRQLADGIFSASCRRCVASRHQVFQCNGGRKRTCDRLGFWTG